ncbi:MAG: hypothetical protein L6Q33_02215 [Bacteriovoracaceae bacterium]|nr:hypothetical protein [Bacteriovoracaceae bacterium]
MKSKLRYGIIGLLVGVILITGYVGVFWSDKRDDAQLELDYAEKIALIEAAKEVESLFRDPESHKLWPLFSQDCLKEYNLSEKDGFKLACSSEILQCYQQYLKTKNKSIFEKNSLKIDFELKFGKNQFYKILFPSTSEDINVTGKTIQVKLMSNRKSDLIVNLEDRCHQVYLDERFFAYGENQSDKSLEITFDTYHKNFFLDKFLVTVKDYNDWRENDSKNYSHLKPIIDHKKFFQPVVHLKKNEMHAYCSFVGKQIMMAHLMDAATFIPFDLRNKQANTFERGSYYWVKKNSEAWVSLAKKKKEDLLTPQNCRLLFGKECAEKFPTLNYGDEPSWSGLLQVMGGPFEYLHNPLNEEENLRTSSKYFSVFSEWNKLAKRIFWDGEGHKIAHFRVFEEDKNVEQIPAEFSGKELEIGFRCVQQILGKE